MGTYFIIDSLKHCMFKIIIMAFDTHINYFDKHYYLRIKNFIANSLN